ncbi:IPT/TIG domain-containing protein [Luteitalea sp. TBR-22]|uniref:IPT/TIG domain-containing protein n=1 Tax=Luteitalea sp. TBR-22 TaxID=2802971 RepID=UPI001EF3EE79|nr:IPT/TIG domain-containing protein [Luteitalea sp. TBR-22]
MRLRVTVPGEGTTLAEGLSLPDGQFALVVPPAAERPAVVQLEAVDRSGEVLARLETRGDRAVVLPLERRPPNEEDTPPLLTDAVTALATQVAQLEQAGELPTGAQQWLAAAVGRLSWLGALVEPARRAMLGDQSAAVVVREALGAWARETPCTDASADEVPGEQEEPRRDDVSVVAETLISADAVGTLMASILSVGRSLDEQVELAEGLGAALSVRTTLEALARAASLGDVPVMSVMMGAPGPMPLGMPGLGLPGGGLPGGGLPGGGFPGGGFPGAPGGLGGRPKGPSIVRVHPTVADVVERFRSADMFPPSDKQRCLIFAVTEVARLQASFPDYRITALSPADACPGQELTITGVHFGTHGSVVFPGTAAPITSAAAIEWTDTRIRVTIPSGAAPGLITLSILEASFMRCGQVFTVFRRGASDDAFAGGTAAVTAFRLDGSKDPQRVEPGAVVSISCDVTVHPTTRTRVFVTRDGTTLADFGTLVGGGHRQHDFTAPVVTQPATCIVHLLVGGPCGEVDHLQTITVAARPRLGVAHLEVTQGVQDAAHTVQLVEGRTTGVRAYLTSGLGAFTYTGVPGEVAGVTGTLQVERGGVVVASIAPAGPVTINAGFADVDRSGTAHALLFVVPGALMSGDVTMRVTARAPGLPGFGADTPSASGSRVVRARPAGTLTVIQLRMGLTNPAHPTPAPSDADWKFSAVGTQDRYPLGDTDLWVAVPATGDLLSTDHFLGKKGGWEDALDDLDDYADRYNEFTFIFACTVPSGAFALNGISHAANDRPWPLENDRRCFLSQSRRRATFAHEMAHTLGVGHAPCADPGTDFPEGIDPNLGPNIGAGVVGWRTSDGALMPPMWAELMSYCTPANGIYDDRWPSIALWHILIDQLN